MSAHRLFAPTLLSATLLTACPLAVSWAGVDPFEFQVYGYQTQGKGNLDPELLSSYIAVGHKAGDGGSSPTYASQNMMRYALEFEYGLTDKIDFAYYLNLAKADAQDIQYAGSKFRFRGRIAEAGELPVEFGWSSEVEWWSSKFNDDQLEGEFMLYMQKDLGPWTVIVNAPDLEKVIVGNNKNMVFEIGWRGEVSYQTSERTRVGLQVYGSPGTVNDPTPLAQQQQYVVPTVHTMLFNAFRSSLGLGFGLNEGSDLFFLKANIHFGGDLKERIYD